MPTSAKAVMVVAEREFNVQVMETNAQWNSGLQSRLTMNGDGLSLFVNPVFDSWLVVDDLSGGGGDIVVDEGGQTYWVALESTRGHSGKRAWNLMRHNPITGEVERLLSFAGCGKIEPKKLWLSPDYLWIFDETESGTSADRDGSRKGRVLAMSRDNYQIIYEISVDRLFDVDLDKKGFLYTLVKDESGQRQICRYSIPPFRASEKECRKVETWRQPKSILLGPEGRKEYFSLKKWQGPEALAVGRNGLIYVLDPAFGRFIRFDPETKEETLLGELQEKLLKGLKWTAMQIDDRGVIFLASPSEPKTPLKAEKPAALHMFNEDGSYLGEVELPSSVKSVSGIGFDRNGGVFLATDQGLARFSLAKNPVGQEGLFYSKTLDNGQVESLWHRVALRGSIPSKTSVEVYYYTTDNQNFKDAYERAFSRPGSVEERVAGIEGLLQNNWIGPETFIGTEPQESASSRLPASQAQEIATPDLILSPNKGRFLWLKLKLITFDEKTRPSIRSARIYYPRLSYLRYLPPVYREDPVSAAFLERFLSIFETVFEGLDQAIDQLFTYFDPRLVPRDFLPWLASWINLALDDDLPEARMRLLIRRAPYLYGRKGTPEALIEFLEIYTGRAVFLTEHSRSLKPQVLGGPDFRLGQGTLLLGTGPKGMRVGDTTVVGFSAIRDRVSDPDEPFLPLARRFTIRVDLDRAEFQKRAGTLRRIIDEQKPAHTICTIQFTAEQKAVGSAVLGVSATVVDTQPHRVGITPLGSGSAVTRDPRTLRLERGAWIGSAKRLG